MESRKMMLSNLFAGQAWRYRRSEWTWGRGKGQTVGQITHYLSCIKQTASGKLLNIALGAQLCTLGWAGGWEGEGRR